MVENNRRAPLPVIGGGAFSEVFDLGDGRVLKAFKDIALSVAPEADCRLIPTVAFAAEYLAYQRLQAHDDLEPYAPRFFGAASPNDFPLDSTESYSSGCGLLLERIPGEAQKLSRLPKPIQRKADDVLEAMQARVGIDDPWDGSAFVPGTRRPFTVIDFATPSDRFYALDKIVSSHGTVSGEFEQVLGITEAKERWSRS